MYEILDPTLNVRRTGPDPRRIQLPLDIVSVILSHIKSPADLCRIVRSSRIHHFLAAPLLYHTVALRRPSRRAGGKRMALGALMKPGIAACVKVLEIIADDDTNREEEEWWEKGQWPDEETVWAAALAGVVAGMVRLDTFLWNTDGYIHPLLYTVLARHPSLKSLRVLHPPISLLSPLCDGSLPVLTSSGLSSSFLTSLYRPPITSIPAFRTIRCLHLHNLPNLSSLIDDFSAAIFPSPSLESLSVSWRIPTPVRWMFLQRFLKHPRPAGKQGEAVGKRTSAGTTNKQLRLKELELRNVIFDFPMVGDVEEWIDLRRLEKLTLLNCEFIDVTSLLELIGASGGGGDRSSAFSGGGYALTYGSPASTTGSTLGTQSSSSSSSSSGSCSSVSRTVRLNLKSLRINSTASHWIALLNSFNGLEELFILDPPVKETTEAAHAAKFLDAITQHHGATLKRLRLCSRWHLDKRDVSRLFRACAGLEELAFSMIQSEWKILDVLTMFLIHLRCFHILDCSSIAREKLVSELMSKKNMIDSTLAQDDMLKVEVFAISEVVFKVDQTPSRDEAGLKIRRARLVELDQVRELAGIWRADK